MSFLKYFWIILSASMAISCSEEEQFINSTNQLYTYHAPQMTNRAVFVYDYSKDTLGRLTKDLGTFDLSLERVADTLNYMIRNSFTTDMIYSYLLESNIIEIATARLEIVDTFDIKKDRIIQLDKIREPRRDVGNLLLPGVFLDNFNREILACNDFFRVIGQDTIRKEPFDQYFAQSCNTLSDTDAVRDFILAFPTNIVIDTISIEQVNYIYISY